jgi:hypothetical protein
MIALRSRRVAAYPGTALADRRTLRRQTAPIRAGSRTSAMAGSTPAGFKTRCQGTRSRFLARDSASCRTLAHTRHSFPSTRCRYHRYPSLETRSSTNLRFPLGDVQRVGDLRISFRQGSNALNDLYQVQGRLLVSDCDHDGCLRLHHHCRADVGICILWNPQYAENDGSVALFSNWPRSMLRGGPTRSAWRHPPRADVRRGRTLWSARQSCHATMGARRCGAESGTWGVRGFDGAGVGLAGGESGHGDQAGRATNVMRQLRRGLTCRSR